MNIIFDFDEVLVDSIQAVFKVLGIPYTDFYKWDFSDCEPLLEAVAQDDRFKSVLDVFSCDEFHNVLKVKVGVYGLLNELKRNGHKIFICTIGTLDNIHYKSRFIKERFGDVLEGVIFMNNTNKGGVSMEGAIFVDDCYQNLIDSNARYKICFQEYGKKEWNERWKWNIARDYVDLKKFIDMAIKIDLEIGV